MPVCLFVCKNYFIGNNSYASSVAFLAGKGLGGIWSKPFRVCVWRMDLRCMKSIRTCIGEIGCSALRSSAEQRE